MSVADLTLPPKLEPKRDRFGRYLICGEPHTRATTWAATVADQFNLSKWGKRTVARGLSLRKDLLAAVAAVPEDDSKQSKAKLDALCDQALEAAKGSAGATLGSALHAFTERVDRGETFHIPAPWDADVAAYRNMLDTYKFEPSMIEKTVVCHGLKVAGTFDRVYRTPQGPMIGDLKTGGYLAWDEIAIQLAIYAHADGLYDPVDDRVMPMVAVDKARALVIHLPAEQATCTVYEVDIAAGWEMAQVCGVVRRWRKRADLAVAYDPSRLDTHIHDWQVDLCRTRLRALIDAGHGQFVADNWPPGIPTFREGGHTPEQLAFFEEFLYSVEAEFRMPFPNPPVDHQPNNQRKAGLR